MKICHILSGDLWAGAEVMAYSLLRSLAGSPEVELSVIILNEGELERRLRMLEVEVYLVEEEKIGFVELVREVRKIVAREKFDVLHSHRYKENIAAVIVRGVSRSPALVSTQHGLPEFYGGKSSRKFKAIMHLNFFVLNFLFSQIVAVSGDLENVLVERYRFKLEKLKVIYNGTPIKPAVKRGHNDIFRIGTAGRLTPVKDFLLFIEMASLVCRKKKNVEFILAGEGPEREKIEKLVAQYNLEGVVLLIGHVEDMTSFYERLDLYVNTSHHEGIPMTILEAMKKSLPILAPKVGGIPEIFDDGEQGFMIPQREAQMYAEKCLYLMDHRDVVEKMGEAARERIVNLFSEEAMGGKYLTLYKNVVFGAKKLNR